jgi:hypothetical protein
MNRRRDGPQRRASVLVSCLLLLSTSARVVQAGGPSAACQARRAGDRVVASLELAQLLDAETQRLLTLGMKGRLRVEATVVRRRLGLFEQTVGTATSEAVLAAGAAGHGLLVNGRLQPDASGPITLERVAVRLSGRERPDETLTFRATIQLRVVTVESLSKLAAWVTDSSEEDASSSLLTRALLSAVANDLTRTVECSCSTAAAP